MNDKLDMYALAAVINQKGNDPTNEVRLRRGVVTAVTVATALATVTIGGTSVANIPCDRGAIPIVGDTVDVLLDGPAARVINVTGGMVWFTVGAAGAPAFTGAWVQEFGRPLSFGRDSDGFVHIRGKTRFGTAADVFTLPSGYRPAADEDFLCMTPGGTTGNGLLPCQLKVTSGGAVQVIGAPSNPQWLSMLATNFFADGS